MKKIKLAKIASLILTAATAMSFASCSNKNTDNGGNDVGNASSDGYKAGVIQYGSHPSLDNCYAGVEEALKAAGITDIDRQDGNFDSATCDTIAKNMVAKNYDIIYAIATPAAVSAYAAAANTDIPVIFCAVSDPVAAGIVEDMAAPGGNCTGTSDILDFSSQVELIQALQPDVKKIGVLYTTSEANSVSQLASLKEVAESKGLNATQLP